MPELVFQTFRFERLDRMAITLSGLCLVHCLATAVLLGAGLVSSCGGGGVGPDDRRNRGGSPAIGRGGSRGEPAAEAAAEAEAQLDEPVRASRDAAATSEAAGT